MNLEKITLKNYKIIEKVEIDLEPGINLLIGDNGVGKTSVLEGIAVALSGLFVNVPGVSTKNIVKDDVRLIIETAGDSSSSVTYCEPIHAGCTLKTCDGNEFTWKRIKEELSSTHTKMDDKAVCTWMKKQTNQSDTNLPLISFQSAARAWKVRRGDFGTELKKKLDDRRCGYIGCLDSSMDVKSIQQWCMKQEVIAVNKGKAIVEYEMFKRIISEFMKEINELDKSPQVYYSPQYGELAYKDCKEDMAISKLSAGYQSLLWMIMDLAYRVCLLNPGLQEMSQIKGIVLIDEIDMHLHPKWQWNIIKALQTTFPKVQFIVATHSPMVISSAKQAKLILLDEEQKVSYPAGCYGYEVEDVLRFRQESVSRPKNVQVLIDKINEFVDDGNFNGAENILEQLEKILGESNSEFKKIKGIVEDAKMIWEC
ncbi:MAG: AAA family ATPase [Lachnospiraceae bacterium]|nr:AAA family ATPase [Lachnospiraceae bacterium]